ncbi:MAG TPA: hypothetical protein VFU32_07145, partial [Ktedonobacterales bacterium]|nr:hypothetical protein [Ktedonobacterales bacterium]
MRLLQRFLSLSAGLSMVAALMLTLAVTGVASAAPASAARESTPHYMGIMGVYGGKSAAATPAASTNDLHYQGGAVETAPLVYISWWGSQWNTGFSTGGYTSAQAQTYITGFFSNVGGSSWDHINVQYCQGTTIGSTTCTSGSTHITNPT